MINGKLLEFVCNVIAKGHISYGDVRRLQRDYLPSRSHEFERIGPPDLPECKARSSR
jgi:hypothetical protein